LLRDKIQTLP